MYFQHFAGPHRLSKIHRQFYGPTESGGGGGGGGDLLELALSHIFKHSSCSIVG